MIPETDLYKFYEEAKRLEEYNCFITLKEPENEFGIPVIVKDNICTKGIRTTAGSRIIENYIPPFDATVVEKVKGIGGETIGKTNMDEFGFGTFNMNSYFGPVKNPLDKQRVSGGSSGGSACATKLLDVPHISIAESTGGSISCPAAFCEVIGFTPTYGRVSRYGLIDYANSLDKIGVMGRDLTTVVFSLNVIQGRDGKDQTCVGGDDLLQYLDTEFSGKIAVIKNMMVGNKVDDVIRSLEKCSLEYDEVSLPYLHEALAAYYIIATSEASTNLAKFCGMRYGISKELIGNFDEYFSEIRAHGFGKEAKRRIILGTFARMAGYRDHYYLKALKIRRLLINEFKKLFKKYSVLITPTMPCDPPKIEEAKNLKPLEVYQMDLLTIPPNLAGIPMMSYPVGRFSGMHILADHFKEGNIISFAKILEERL